MRRLAVLFLTMLATTTTAVGLSGPTWATAPSCSVDYTVTAQWYGYFQANISVSYTGFPAASGWTLAFDFTTPDQRIVNGWTSTWNQSGRHVVASSGPFPSAVASDGSMMLGFIASYVSINPKPVNFAFDGVACNQLS